MKVSFFSILKNIILSLSLIFFIFITSFCLVTMTYYNHKEKSIVYENVEIYQIEKISNFNAYFKNNDMFILIKLKEKQNNEFLLDYAYYYFFKFHKNTYLEAIYNDDTSYIVINNGIASLLIKPLQYQTFDTFLQQ